MKCDQCGATLQWDGTRPIVVCEFCGSIESIDLVGSANDSVDRVVSLDQPGDSQCPRCREHLVEAAMDGMKVEHCEDCRGVLIPNEVMAILVRNRRASFRGAEARAVPVDREQLKIVVNCPGCERAMEVHPYYGPGNIVIDSCCKCGLVWLDCGEMRAVELAPGRR